MKCRYCALTKGKWKNLPRNRACTHVRTIKPPVRGAKVSRSEARKAAAKWEGTWQ